MGDAYFSPPNKRRNHGLGTNAPPDPQVATQASLVVNREDMESSYLQNTNDTKPSGEVYVNTYFKPTIGVPNNLEIFDISEYGIVWAPKNVLDGNCLSASKWVHKSVVVDMLMVRSAFNNFQFNDITDFLIQYLHVGTNGYNDKYISEIMSALIMPIGVSKVKVPFSMDPTKNMAVQTFEVMTSGVILSKVRRQDAFIKHGYHMRFTVPTPADWNNSRWYCLEETVGKITMQVEPITIQADECKIRTIHTGFIGNDVHKIHGFLQDVHARHKSIQPLISIPTDFLHLLAAIYIDVTKRDIATGVLELNNRYRYHSLQRYMTEFFRRNSANTPEALFSVFLNRTKNRSVEQLSNLLVSTYLKALPDKNETVESLSLAVSNVLSGIAGGNVGPVFIDLIDLEGLDFEVFSADGYSEEDWQAMLSSKDRDAALDWSKILYYFNDGIGMEPVTENPGDTNTPTDIGMFGDYLFKSTLPPTAGPSLPEISKENTINMRKVASEDFAIIAAQVLGLTVSAGFHSNASTQSPAEGYLYANRKNPEFQRIIRDSEARARRMIIEVARNIMAEYMPSELRERSRIGYDRNAKRNLGMRRNNNGHHLFDDFADIGRLSKESGAVFGEWTTGVASYLHWHREQVKMTVTGAAKAGNIAVTFLKT
jgi:hypothetical protein